jgi:hypothetical protein
MRSKFSSLLLTGKAATLPLLMSNAQALTPSFVDVVSARLSQVQLPVAGQVQLNALGGGTYDGSAVICSDTTTMANKMSIVLTGLQDQDTVYLVTSTDLGGNQGLNANLKIGTKNLVVASSMGVRAAGSTNMSVSVTLDLLTGINWSQAKLSEVDVVTIDNCAPTNPYGSYGGTY